MQKRSLVSALLLIANTSWAQNPLPCSPRQAGCDQDSGNLGKTSRERYVVLLNKNVPAGRVMLDVVTQNFLGVSRAAIVNDLIEFEFNLGMDKEDDLLGSDNPFYESDDVFSLLDESDVANHGGVEGFDSDYDRRNFFGPVSGGQEKGKDGPSQKKGEVLDKRSDGDDDDKDSEPDPTTKLEHTETKRMEREGGLFGFSAFLNSEEVGLLQKHPHVSLLERDYENAVVKANTDYIEESELDRSRSLLWDAFSSEEDMEHPLKSAKNSVDNPSTDHARSAGVSKSSVGSSSSNVTLSASSAGSTQVTSQSVHDAREAGENRGRPGPKQHVGIPPTSSPKDTSRHLLVVHQAKSPRHLSQVSWTRKIAASDYTLGNQLSGKNGYMFQPVAGRGVDVYVLDSGVTRGHPEFGGRVLQGANFAQDETVADDVDGHGTHVAGLIGGETVGTAKRATLINVRVLDSLGRAPYSSVIAGIEWAVKSARRRRRPAVINLSVSSQHSRAFLSALYTAHLAGIHIVSAAGNDYGSNACQFTPANFKYAISVGSSSDSGKPASFSNLGKCVDVFGPGVDIDSCKTDGKFIKSSGTSMTAGIVSGGIAVVLSQLGFVPPTTLKNWLLQESHKNLLRRLPLDTANRFVHFTPRRLVVNRRELRERWRKAPEPVAMAQLPPVEDLLRGVE